MQILVDVRLLSKGGQTGIEEYTRQIVSRLVKSQKHNFLLFYNAFRKHPLGLEGNVIDWRIPNKIFDLWRPNIDKFFDIDLAYSPHINILNTKNKPKILTIHDLSFIHFPYFFSWKHRFWHLLQNTRKQAQEAAAIVANSQYTKNDIAETLKISPEKIHCIYPGIDPSLKKITIQKPANLSFPYILYLGTLEPRKNIPIIIESFQLLKQQPRFKNLKLIIAGKPGWLYKPQPISDVIYWGPVSHQEKIMLYNLAEAFVFPSFFEGFGFPPLEAQACGCPVVASNRASIKETLGSSALLINPWKPKELAEALEAILTDNKLGKTLIAAGTKNVQRFNWEQTTCELLKLFSQFSS